MQALGVTSLPSPGAAGPSSSSDAAAAGALIGTKRPAAGDASQAFVDAAAAGSGASYPKRTRAADASEAAAAAGEVTSSGSETFSRRCLQDCWNVHCFYSSLCL